MARPIERVVDAHIHLWDPARTDWYPYLSGQEELGMGDMSAMCRLLDLRRTHAHLDVDARDKLFASNVERVYRC